MDNFTQKFQLSKHKRRLSVQRTVRRQSNNLKVPRLLAKGQPFRHAPASSLQKSRSVQCNIKAAQQPVFPRYSLTAYFDPQFQVFTRTQQAVPAARKSPDVQLRRWDLPSAYIQRVKSQNSKQFISAQQKQRARKQLFVKTIQNVQGSKLKQLVLKKYRREVHKSCPKVVQDEFELSIYGQHKDPELFSDYILKGLPSRSISPQKTPRRRVLMSRTSRIQGSTSNLSRNQFGDLDPWSVFQGLSPC